MASLSRLQAVCVLCVRSCQYLENRCAFVLFRCVGARSNCTAGMRKKDLDADSSAVVICVLAMAKVHAENGLIGRQDLSMWDILMFCTKLLLNWWKKRRKRLSGVSKISHRGASGYFLEPGRPKNAQRGSGLQKAPKVDREIVNLVVLLLICSITSPQHFRDWV